MDAVLCRKRTYYREWNENKWDQNAKSCYPREMDRFPPKINLFLSSSWIDQFCIHWSALWCCFLLFTVTIYFLAFLKNNIGKHLNVIFHSTWTVYINALVRVEECLSLKSSCWSECEAVNHTGFTTSKETARQDKQTIQQVCVSIRQHG